MASGQSIPRRRNFARRGFTLIEAAIVTVIVGVGTVAMIQLLAAGSMANGHSHELTTGMNLANNVREMTQTMAFSDVLALNNKTYDPAVDAMQQPVTSLSGWKQQVAATRVVENAVTVTTTATDSNIARVTVAALHNNEKVCEVSWLVVRTE
jgi:prepilin-type N-terminal cleavage/methylation domain-containing protein